MWLAKERRSQLNNTVELSLSKTDKVAIIDEEDMPRVMAFSVSWYYHKERGYAFTNKTSIDLGRRITVELHRFIAGTPQGFDTDHVNGDKLDNRKDNLRICSRLENLQNRKARRQFTGVYRLPRNCGYAATIQKKWLGQFETSEDAARAYNRASREITGGNIPVNDVPDPFEIDGFDFDDVQVKVEHPQIGTKTIRRSNLLSFRSDIDVTDQVSYDEDGHPDHDSLHKVASEMMAEIAKGT